MGDPRLWRQALSELDTLPLSPLNLPLPVWDLYQSHPFESVKLRLANGTEIAIPDWSKLYYSWHGRRFAFNAEKVVNFFEASEVLGGESNRPPATQITILERLRWLKTAKETNPFMIRTRHGRGFLIDGPNRFQLDSSASLLVLRLGDDQPLEFIPVVDIASVALAGTEPRVLTDQLLQRLHATPFLPFQVLLIQGDRYTVNRAQDVLITTEFIIVGLERGGSEIHQKVVEIPLTWVDKLEIIPSEK
jgi:hypothetical protein